MLLLLLKSKVVPPVVTPAPLERTFLVAAESRVKLIAAENRVKSIPAESRTLIVKR